MAWRFLSSVDGFPGDVELKVAYALHGATMTVEYQAEVKLQPTPLNFTVHPFFNLNGDPRQSILDHRLEIFSDHFLPVDRQRIPLGYFESVSDTPFDFRSPKTIGQSLRHDHEQLGWGAVPGFDHAWLTPGVAEIGRAHV